MIELFKATGMVKNCPRLPGDSNWIMFSVSQGKALNMGSSILCMEKYPTINAPPKNYLFQHLTGNST